MVFSLTPMVILVAFAVNIGMLVHAKIQLQNAADLAAYVGAATQARQLTQISHLNYGLRQAWKKFLYKYYVIGNLSMKCYPRSSGEVESRCPGPNVSGRGRIEWRNVQADGTSTGFPGVPMVCISLSRESNPCQLARAVAIVRPPPCVPLDPTCGQLRNAAEAIAQLQIRSCANSSVVNLEVLNNWLYATEYERDMQTNRFLRGLIANDVGLTTETMLLNFRIETLESYINTPGRINVDRARSRALQENGDPSKNERTVLAYETAIGNLNQEVFDHNQVKLTEILPTELMPPLVRKRPSFEAWAAHMDGDNPEAGCQMMLEKYPAAPIAGVFKASDKVVYYAVKLTAQAKLLFNPFPMRGGGAGEEIELTAYAAARPFGSRIGPALEDADFQAPMTATGPTGQVSSNVPILKITDDNSVRWDSGELLRAFYENLGNGRDPINQRDIERGIRTALLPDQYEIGKYNIPVNPISANIGVPYFSPSTDTYTFWAPLISIGGNRQFEGEVETEINSLINTVTTRTGTIVTASSGLRQSLIASLARLRGQLQSMSNFNVARMVDPLGTKYFQDNTPVPTAIPGKVLDRLQLASSYASDHWDAITNAGREGYSVKMIPFKSLLTTPGKLSNSPDRNWTSARDAFVGAVAEDAQRIAH